MTLDTAQYILEKVAPVFNRKGYVGTTLTDLSVATNLTKGAIYSNFVNKEDLALKAFKRNLKIIFGPLYMEIGAQNNSLAKLRVITDFYRNYFARTKEYGGCPLLNVGMDAKAINPNLYQAALKVARDQLEGLTTIIQTGIDNKEIRKDISAKQYAENILCMIEGATFMAQMHNDGRFMENIASYIVQLIHDKMKI